MAGSFGIGLGSFLTGAVQGAQAYAGIQDARSRNKLNELRVKEAESDLAEKTRLQDLEADQNRRKQVGMEQAELAHPDNIMKQMEYYTTNTIPALQKEYIKAGQDQTAQVLGKFVETEQGKTLTRLSAASINSAFMGDKTGLKTSMQETVNTASNMLGTPKYEIGDITDAVGEDGKPTGGIVIPIKDASGNVQNMTFNSTSDLVKFINNTSTPHAIVASAVAEEAAAQKQRAELAKENREYNRDISKARIQSGLGIQRDNNTFTNQTARDRQQQQYALQRDKYQAEIKQAYGITETGAAGSKKVAEAEAAANYLRLNGYTDAQIKEVIPALLGVQNNAKNPTVRLEETIKMLSNSDPRFGQLPPQEKVKRARALIKEIDGGGSSSGKGLGGPYIDGNGQLVYPSLSGGDTVDNPFNDGDYYIDEQTGQVVYR